MPERPLCDICHTPLAPHAFYVVKIDVFADPSVPAMSTEELEEMDVDKTYADLMEQMKHMTAEDLQDQVHRRFEYKLCPRCQPQFLANPLGMPRDSHPGRN
jgi:hypothetical protein